MSGVLERWKAKWQEEAMQAGILRGFEQGIEQGIEVSHVETAQKMLAEGILPVHKIADYVGLSVKEIESLKKTLLS